MQLWKNNTYGLLRTPRLIFLVIKTGSCSPLLGPKCLSAVLLPDCQCTKHYPPLGSEQAESISSFHIANRGNRQGPCLKQWDEGWDGIHGRKVEVLEEDPWATSHSLKQGSRLPHKLPWVICADVGPQQGLPVERTETELGIHLTILVIS